MQEAAMLRKEHWRLQFSYIIPSKTIDDNRASVFVHCINYASDEALWIQSLVIFKIRMSCIKDYKSLQVLRVVDKLSRDIDTTRIAQIRCCICRAPLSAHYTLAQRKNKRRLMFSIPSAFYVVGLWSLDRAAVRSLRSFYHFIKKCI